jgi:hypothetical protein
MGSPVHSIRGRSMADQCHPRRQLHAQEELGFHGEDTHQGHRGQPRARIGRGIVKDGRRRCRSCMQRLGVRANSSGARVSTVMASSASALL